MQNEFLSLNTGCTAITLPALPADIYCEAVPGSSQLVMLVITPCAAQDDPFLLVGSATQPSLTAGAIDNDASDNTKTRVLIGQGGIDEHEPTLYEGTNGRDYVTKRKYRVSFKVSLGSSTGTGNVRDFLRNMQRNFTQFRFWPIDEAGLLYGPVLSDSVTNAFGGIRPSFVNVQMPKDASRDGVNEATIIIDFISTVDPPAYTSPLTFADACVPTA